jgi:hypothetical protein
MQPVPTDRRSIGRAGKAGLNQYLASNARGADILKRQITAARSGVEGLQLSIEEYVESGGKNLGSNASTQAAARNIHLPVDGLSFASSSPDEPLDVFGLSPAERTIVFRSLLIHPNAPIERTVAHGALRHISFLMFIVPFEAYATQRVQKGAPPLLPRVRRSQLHNQASFFSLTCARSWKSAGPSRLFTSAAIGNNHSASASLL